MVLSIQNVCPVFGYNMEKKRCHGYIGGGAWNNFEKKRLENIEVLCQKTKHKTSVLLYVSM